MSLSPASFHELYQKYSREVYRFSFYLCGDASRAGDLTAEAFTRIWVSPAPTRLETVKSYLFAIVRNLHAERWRSERREVPIEEAREVPAAEVRRDGKAELARVLAGLAHLAPLDRAALLLRAEHGLDYGEIARILDVTPVSARVKVHRARQQLIKVR